MAGETYFLGRKKYVRPQGMLWSENAGRLVDGKYLPYGYEIGADLSNLPVGTSIETEPNQFLILSDDNRQPLDFQTSRIETRERMINGRMRSYHIADKLTLSTSWDMLPSRSFNKLPLFDSNGLPTGFVTSRDHDEDAETPEKNIQLFGSPYNIDQQFTSDGGAGGVEIVEWYETHPGPFWVYLSYDKYTNFEDDRYSKLAQYNQIIQMYISSFNYSVQKRGGSNHDFWNISVTLEEV